MGRSRHFASHKDREKRALFMAGCPTSDPKISSQWRCQMITSPIEIEAVESSQEICGRADSFIVSIVQSAKSTATTDELLDSVMDGIRSGKWQKEVQAVRAANSSGKKSSARELKLRLPGILFSGQFEYRSGDGLTKYTGIICADMDDCAMQLDEIRDAANRDPNVLGAFVSPSGTGMKLLFVTDASVARHREAFEVVRVHCHEIYGIEIDQACKDIARLCFVSHDHELLYNPDANVIHVPPVDPVSNNSVSAIQALEATEQVDVDAIKIALKFIPADEYTLWRDIGFALHDWDALEGLAVFDEWSKTSSRYIEGYCERHWASIKGGKTTGKGITIRTLLYHAENNGWSGNSKKLNIIAAQLFHGDGAYWRLVEAGGYVTMTVDQMRRELRVVHHVSGSSRDGNPSDVDKVMNIVEHKQSIHGAAPFIHNPKKLVVLDGKRYLNTSVVECIKPSNQSGIWGDGFQFIAGLIDQQFDPEARCHLINWLAHFFQSALKGRLSKGTALIIVGGPKRGKTLLSNKVIGGLVGGCVDASDYLLGESNFNSEMFERAVWAIDDSLGAVNHHNRTQFTNRLKKTVANHQFKCEAKFRVPITLPWHGRIIITANDDTESLQILPNMDMTIRDKVSLLMIKGDAPVVNVANPGDLVDSELPAFAHWLQEYAIPEEVKDGRFGVEAYHDAKLLEEAVDSSPSAVFREMFSVWRKSIMADEAPEPICMTATEILNNMKGQLGPVSSSIGCTKEQTLGRRLTALSRLEPTWLKKTKSGGIVRYTVFP
jgi:hypothetical protein